MVAVTKGRLTTRAVTGIAPSVSLHLQNNGCSSVKRSCFRFRISGHGRLQPAKNHLYQTELVPVLLSCAGVGCKRHAFARRKFGRLTPALGGHFDLTTCNDYSLSVKIRDLIRKIDDDGWYLVRTKGSHRQYKHPSKKVWSPFPGSSVTTSLQAH